MTELIRKCVRCENELRPGASFCQRCGTRAAETDEAPNGPGFTSIGPAPAGPQTVTAPQPTASRQPEFYQPPSSYLQPEAGQPTAGQPYQPPFQPPGPLGPPTPPRHDRGSRGPLIWSILAGAVAGAAVVALVLVLFHPFGRGHSTNDAADTLRTTSPTRASGGPTGSPSATGSGSASGTGSAAEKQAATTLAGMLSGSVTDRTAIDNAAGDVDTCGPNLRSDAGVFTTAASSRKTMLASLATMPGRSALPAALLTDLADAWQASIAADQGYATWASDEVAKGCTPGDTSDPGYQATVTPDAQATTDKTAFVAQWNPIATRYGLTTYQQNQL